MVDIQTRRAILSSWPTISPEIDVIVGLFYMRLTELRPDLGQVLPHDLAPQKREMTKRIAYMVGVLLYEDGVVIGNSVTTFDPTNRFLIDDVMKLGHQYRVALDGLDDDSFAFAFEALDWALTEWHGTRLTAEERRAWSTVLRLLLDYMRLGAMVGQSQVA